MRSYTLVDQVIIQFADCLQAILPKDKKQASRQNPGDSVDNPPLTPAETQASIRLMRVNHSGEVCAQALYQGQALLARQPSLKAHFTQAAQEEREHLKWCADRVKSLGGKTSRLNPLWALGSFCIGILAACPGPRTSLGFLAETEMQVSEHLDKHLAQLPSADQKSRAILQQMRLDEQAHAQGALDQGGQALPPGIPLLMRLSAKVMTCLTLYV